MTFILQFICQYFSYQGGCASFFSLHLFHGSRWLKALWVIWVVRSPCYVPSQRAAASAPAAASANVCICCNVLRILLLPRQGAIGSIYSVCLPTAYAYGTRSSGRESAKSRHDVGGSEARYTGSPTRDPPLGPQVDLVDLPSPETSSIEQHTEPQDEQQARGPPRALRSSFSSS